MSEFTIRMDFARARAEAAKLDDIADGIAGTISGDFDSAVDAINQNWKGDSATAYLHKSEDLREKAERTIKNLRDTAEVIRTIAQNIYDSEMQALEIASLRDH